MRIKFNASWSGYLSVIGATIIWAGNFILARDVNNIITPISLAFWRWVVAVLVCLPFAYKIALKQLPLLKKHIRYLSLCAFLSVTMFNTFIYIAAHTTTAMNLSLISLTFPIFILFFSFFFYKEKIYLRQWFGIVLVIIGVFSLITKGQLLKLMDVEFKIGDLWVLMAAIVFALYSVLLKRKPVELDGLSFLISIFGLGLIFLTPFYIWDISASSYTSIMDIISTDPKIIFTILYMGCFASLCAFVLWNRSIILIGAAKAGLVYYAQPLFSGLLAAIFLHERIVLYHFYSMVLIVSGILVANYMKNKTR